MGPWGAGRAELLFVPTELHHRPACWVKGSRNGEEGHPDSAASSVAPSEAVRRTSFHSVSLASHFPYFSHTLILHQILAEMLRSRWPG